MSVTTAAGAPATVRGRRQGLRPVLRAEWIVLTRLRVTWVLLGASVLLTTGIGLAAAVAFAAQERQGTDVSADVFRQLPAVGLNFAQLFIGSLAVLFVTVEWSSGSIRTTLGALDRRGSLLTAKAVVVSAAAAVTALVGALLVHVLSVPLVSSVEPDLRVGDAGALYHVGATVLFTALVALIAVGVGTCLRSTPGGIVVVIALLIVLPIVLALIPWDALREISRFLPLNAGNELIMIHPAPDGLTHLQSLAALLGWAVAALGLGYLRLVRTDA